MGVLSLTARAASTHDAFRERNNSRVHSQCVSAARAASPAREAPHWRVGAKVYLGFACVSVPMFLGIWWRFRWEEKRERESGRGGAMVDERGEE